MKKDMKFSDIKKFDKHDMRKLLVEFPSQCEEAFSFSVPLPEHKNFNKICFSGMGGSAIGGDILKIFVEIKFLSLCSDLSDCYLLVYILHIVIG